MWGIGDKEESGVECGLLKETNVQGLVVTSQGSLIQCSPGCPLGAGSLSLSGANVACSVFLQGMLDAGSSAPLNPMAAPLFLQPVNPETKKKEKSTNRTEPFRFGASTRMQEFNEYYEQTTKRTPNRGIEPRA